MYWQDHSIQYSCLYGREIFSKVGILDANHEEAARGGCGGRKSSAHSGALAIGRQLGGLPVL
jgi:hypothetical protein